MKIEATPAEMSAFIAELYKEITVIAENRCNKSASEYEEKGKSTKDRIIISQKDNPLGILDKSVKFTTLPHIIYPDPNPIGDKPNVYPDPIGDEPRNTKSVSYDNRTSTTE